MTTILKRLTACMAVALVCMMTSAQNHELISKQVIPLDTTVRRGILNNGLSYYVRRVTKKTENKANLYLLVRGGACMENEDEQGLAHFVEHMMYEGTKHFPGNSVHSFLGRHGLSISQDGNACTTYRHVQYTILNLEYKNYETLDTCLNIFHDMSTDATFDKQSLEKQKAIIEEEMRIYSVLNTKGEDAFYKINNMESPHVVGDTATLRHCSQEKIREFYKRVYQPQNLAIVVVGDIDADKMVEMIKRKFGDLKKGTNKNSLSAIAHPHRKEPKMIFVKDPDFFNSNVRIYVQYGDAYQHNRLTVGSLKEKATIELMDFCSPMMSKNVKGREEMLSFGNSFRENAQTMTKYHLNSIIGRGADWKKALEVYYKYIEKMRRKKYSDGDMRLPHDPIKYNADSTAINFAEYNIDSHDAQEWYNWILNSFVYEEDLTSTEHREAAMTYLRENVSPEEVYEAFMHLTDGHNMTIVMALPEDAEEPTMEEINAIHERVMKMSDDELEENRQQTNLDNIDPVNVNLKLVPGKIKRKKNRKDGFTEVLLSNGIKVLLKEDHDSCSLINYKFQRPSGLYPYGMNEKLFCNRLFNESWRKVRGIDYTHKDFFDECSFTSGKENVESQLKAMHIALTSTEVDSVIFRETLNKCLNYMNLSKGPNDEKIRRILNIHFNQNRNDPSELDILSNMSIDKYQQMLKDSRSNYNGSAMVIYGKFKMKDILPLVAKYIGSLPSTETPVKIKAKEDDHYNTHDDKLILNIKNNVPYGMINSYYSVDKGYEYTPENHAIVDILSISLHKLMLAKIREENKDAYGPRLDVIENQFPYHRISLVFFTNCSPEKIDKVTMDADKVLRDAAYGDLLTQDLIDESIKERLNAKKEINNYHEGALAEKEFLALDKELYGVAIDKDEHRELIKKVTLESARTLLRTLLNNSHHQVGGLSTEVKE